ncbi:MAG: tRNA pseudouridine(54/55) synthase Pus10, partial [Ignisphaera sp.]
LTENTVTPDKIIELEHSFRGLVVFQRTPLRILRRKKDTLRKKKVFSIKILQLAPNLFEVFIKCEGGLYVKELITGDNGRTSPSFSQFLGTQARCLELDVLYVHEYI